MEIKITKENFENEVLKSNIPVLLDFYANWCGPCKMLAPHVEAIANEYEGKVKVGKIDCDEEEYLANEFKVISIPLLVLIKDGKVVKQSAGYINKNQLIDFITK